MNELDQLYAHLAKGGSLLGNVRQDTSQQAPTLLGLAINGNPWSQHLAGSTSPWFGLAQAAEYPRPSEAEAAQTDTLYQALRAGQTDLASNPFEAVLRQADDRRPAPQDSLWQRALAGSTDLGYGLSSARGADEAVPEFNANRGRSLAEAFGPPDAAAEYATRQREAAQTEALYQALRAGQVARETGADDSPQPASEEPVAFARPFAPPYAPSGVLRDGPWQQAINGSRDVGYDLRSYGAPSNATDESAAPLQTEFNPNAGRSYADLFGPADAAQRTQAQAQTAAETDDLYRALRTPRLQSKPVAAAKPLALGFGQEMFREPTPLSADPFADFTHPFHKILPSVGFQNKRTRGMNFGLLSTLMPGLDQVKIKVPHDPASLAAYSSQIFRENNWDLTDDVFLDRFDDVEDFEKIGPEVSNITFVNNDAKRPHTRRAIISTLANALKNAARATGYQININSTTGGHDDGPHFEGRAVDINSINGIRVVDPASRPLIRELIRHMQQDQNIGEIIGPTWSGVSNRNPSKALQAAHEDHLHIGTRPIIRTRQRQHQ
jgi:hypothetical protein